MAGAAYGGSGPVARLFAAGTTAGLSDGQLIDRFSTGRVDEAEAAFAALAARHGPMVLGVCRGLLRDHHDADDAFQATFLVLARKAGGLRSPEKLGPWLHGVARKVARKAADRDRLRRDREREAASARPDAPGPADREAVEILLDEIARLPERYRTAVVLCDLQGLTHEEAGRRLGRPAGTISARVSRARERLRGNLTRRGASPALAIPPAFRAEVPAALAESAVRLALATKSTSGAVPASIAILAQGAFTTMNTMRWLMTTSVMLAGATVAGVTALREAPAPPAAAPDLEEPLKAAVKIVEQAVGDAERIARAAGDLRKLTGGMHENANADNRFLPPSINGADGKPLLSWRVAILPLIGEKDLHAKFKLDEPWDSPRNKPLLAEMPAVFAPIPDAPGMTRYQVFTGEHTMFDDPKGVRIADVTDGTVNTLLIVEAASPVPWTKPEDLAYKAGSPLPKLGGVSPDGFVSVTADGMTRFIPHTIDPTLLDRMIRRDDGEVIDVTGAGESIVP